MKYISIVLILLVLVSCTHNNKTLPEPSNNTGSIKSAKGVPLGTRDISDIYAFNTQSDQIIVHPIGHATAVVEWGDDTIFADPAEDVEKYEGYTPTIVFISHEHGDHFKNDILESLDTGEVKFLASQSVYDQLSSELQNNTVAMNNGDTLEYNGFKITAIPAYNIREEALNFHPEGRDNGYIFEKDEYSVYFSGDSEDTPEMRALQDIDLAFVSMNLPYTMSIESAIDGVLAFAPKTIFPYHYRGKEGLSDIALFKKEVESKNKEINVIVADWYKE